MGTITRSFANNITTSGLLLPASLTNNSIANVTAYNASVSTGGMVLLSTQTASNSASISFTSSINSTYKEYQFWFYDIHARTDKAYFSYNFSTDSGSNYNVTKTSTLFGAYQFENNTAQDLTFRADQCLAQSTGFQTLSRESGSDADQSDNGFIKLFNPSSTTYVKHYIARISSSQADDAVLDNFSSGYGNTTSAINAVQFKMTTGNMDGTILMYGIV
jgi:hypothetical protein